MPTFAGEFIAPGTPVRVYEFLVDPHRLVKCLPGLKSHEVQDDEHFSVTLRVGLGVVGGPMKMKMEILDKSASCFARILGKGSILNSSVSVSGSFTLSSSGDDATRVRWTGDAKIARYIMHLVGGALNRLVQEHVERFVYALKEELTGEALGGR